MGKLRPEGLGPTLGCQCDAFFFSLDGAQGIGGGEAREKMGFSL